MAKTKITIVAAVDDPSHPVQDTKTVRVRITAEGAPGQLGYDFEADVVMNAHGVFPSVPELEANVPDVARRGEIRQRIIETVQAWKDARQ
ncbi:MAG: hypothetical protein LAO51_19020 [Acidobacteriia bacterium]|nr:hypothetical protein [Terriglobia bacterium]